MRMTTKNASFNDQVGLVVALGALATGVAVVVGGVRIYSMMSGAGATWAFWLFSTLDLARAGLIAVVPLVVAFILAVLDGEDRRKKSIRRSVIASLIGFVLTLIVLLAGGLVGPPRLWVLIAAVSALFAAVGLGSALGDATTRRYKDLRVRNGVLVLCVVNGLYLNPMACGVIESRIEFRDGQSVMPRVLLKEDLRQDWRLVSSVDQRALIVKFGPDGKQFRVVHFDSIEGVRDKGRGFDVLGAVLSGE
jgi:hypothetical protein